ncbi:MAG: hypothetical protein GY924_27485, partial [Planctomycetaceae bacterium]|nr:hypothetical protein [Planctomycetaceae bacterium]
FIAQVGQQVYDDFMADMAAGDYASAVGRLSGTAVDVFLAGKGLLDTAATIKTIALRNVDNVAPNTGLLWGSWNDYPKVTVSGRTYAQIGDRQYSSHAVDRMQPSSLGTPAGADGPGRNVTPNMVEEVIGTGTPNTTIIGGVERTIYRSGNVSVVTENSGNTIVTILRHSSP